LKKAVMKSVVTIASFLALGALAAPAAAQLARNSDAPVDITADELEVAQNQCVSIWRGNAEAMQADARLRANVLKATFASRGGAQRGAGATSGCGDLLRMEAEGAVYYVTPQQRVRGDAATYDAGSDTIVMTGDVVAVQGQNVLRGTRMVFNLKTGEGRMVGGATGRNAPNRPRGVFFPSKKTAAQ
jgi:lipopolysaccharide export system protein LptA